MHRCQPRHQPRKSHCQPQQKQRLHHPQHRNAGDHRPHADAQAPQHQHREGSRRGAGGNAGALCKTLQTLRQPIKPRVPDRLLQILPGFDPKASVVGIPHPADAGTTRHRAHHCRKGKFKADIPHRIAVDGGHQDACRRQRGESIRRAPYPHTQGADPHRHGSAAHRGRKAGHAHQHQRQQAFPDRAPSAAAVALLPAIGQQNAQDIPAQNGNMHAADHQHMGKPCAPVGTAQLRRKPAAVAHRHSRQHAAGVPVHLPAQALAQFLLQAVGAGAEAATLAQHGELRLFGQGLCLQGDAVCVLRRLFFHVRLLQREPALHPLPCRAGGQLRTGYAEPRRAAVHAFYPQGRVHCVRKIVTVRALHLSSQQHGTPGVICPGTLQPGARGMHRAKPCQCTQQQADRQLTAAIRDAKQQQKGNKKCRKRHKKLRLRQKSP